MSCPLHSIDYELFDTHEFICPHALMHAGSDQISQPQPYTIIIIILCFTHVCLANFMHTVLSDHSCVIVSYEQCSVLSFSLHVYISLYI